jgi:thiol-disulfide isomerase/thioredoxin
MTTKSLEIAHITANGKEWDKTPIDPKKITTQKASDVLRMFNEKKPMFIKFYADWCGHCQHMTNDWKALIEETKKTQGGQNIAIVAVEKDAFDEVKSLMNGTKGLTVDGFPTVGMIKYDNNGKAFFTDYNGKRIKSEMLKAVETMAEKKIGGGGKRRLTKKRTKKSKRSKRIKRTKKTKRRN